MEASLARQQGGRSLPPHVDVRGLARTSGKNGSFILFLFLVFGCFVRRGLHGNLFPFEQPYLATNQLRQVSERLPSNTKATWSAEWFDIEYEPDWFSNLHTRGAWPRSGLGWPAQCRPHWKQFGTKCGLNFPALLSWSDLVPDGYKPFLRLCALKRRLVASPPFYAWAMEPTQILEAGRTSLCPWRSGRPTASFVNSCLRWTERRPGCPAHTRSAWLKWGGPQWDVPFWAHFTSPHRRGCPPFGRWPRTVLLAASQPMKLSKGSTSTPVFNWILDSAVSVLASEAGLLAASDEGGYWARNLELAAKPSSRPAGPTPPAPKCKQPAKPSPQPYASGKWQVWTGPSGWQHWSHETEPTWDAARDAAENQAEGPHRTRGVTWADQAGTGSRPAGSRDEWVGRIQPNERAPQTWETPTARGKGERARSASPTAPM
eukprot:5100295-Amphidinium_carterae.2